MIMKNVFSLTVLCILSAPCLSSEDFERAIAPRVFEFPKDFGSHPSFKTEWWYLTGALATERGEELGFQATWFRSGLARALPVRESKLAARDVFLFHGALSDVAAGRFTHDHAVCRGAANWAGAAEGKLDVFLLGRTLKRQDDGTWRLQFSVKGRELELTLKLENEPLLHGETTGLSLKGPGPGQASYYVSLPRLRTSGTVRREPGGKPERVSGWTWFDQEFGSNQLSDAQTGWDWFSARLDDGAT